MIPASLPETPIQKDQRQEEERKRRPRRGCSFLLGLLLLFGFLAAVVLFLFGSLFIGPDLPALSEGIGLVRIEGMILSSDEIVEEINHFSGSDKIRGILIRIDSPGGAVGSSQEIYDAILKARASEQTPVYVSMGNTAASGGYYIAAAADRIIANPGTVTGSIGVIFNLTNWEELVEKVGLRFDVVKSGQFKDIGSGNRSMTDEERHLLQGVIDDTYDQFIEAILAIRQEALSLAMKSDADDDEPTAETVDVYLRGLADGRLFSGRQAFEAGLVDDLGSMDYAVERLAETVGLVDPDVIEARRHPTLIDLLMGSAKSAIHGVRGDSARLLYEMPVR